MSINDKIKQVLTLKNLSPSYLADDIGVQRSSISHILSGRNRPSLDIIQKIVRRFPEFTYEWFLEEEGSAPSPPTASAASTSSVRWPTTQLASSLPPVESQTAQIKKQHQDSDLNNNDQNGTFIPKYNPTSKPTIDRILIFYSDGTFREYLPAGGHTI